MDGIKLNKPCCKLLRVSVFSVVNNFCFGYVGFARLGRYLTALITIALSINHHAFAEEDPSPLWDPFLELKPIAPDRESAPVQPIPFVSHTFSGTTKQEYLKWIEFYYFESKALSNDTTLAERIALTNNRKYDFEYADYASFWFRKLTLEAGAEEDQTRWLNSTVTWMKQSTDYFAAQPKGAVGFPQLVAASRVYMRLRDAGVLDRQVAGSDERVRDCLTTWFLALEANNKDWEFGAMNRSIGRALGIEALVQLLDHYEAGNYPTPDGNAPANVIDEVNSRSEYVERVWLDWSLHGDTNENSSGYLGLDMRFFNQWIDLRDPDKWNDPLDPDVAKIRALAERYLQYMTTLGPIAGFGDTVGWSSTPENWLPVFEKWGAVFQDGRFRWAAENLHKYLVARNENMRQWTSLQSNYMNGLMQAYLHMNDSIAATMPTSFSNITHRKAVLLPDLTLTNETIPDRAIFRTGWSADDAFAMLELSPAHYGHAHFDTGAIQSYVANGSLLLTSPPYRVDELEYQNAFIVQPAVDLPNEQVPPSHKIGGFKYINNPREGPFTYRISFRAQRLYGSPYLQVGRLWGGTNGAQCVIQSDPIETTQHVVEIQTIHAGADILFTPVQSLHPKGKGERVALSKILLDDIKIEDITDPNNPILMSFDDFNNAEKGINGWKGRTEGNATAQVAHQGSALELTMLIDNWAVEVTTTPTIDAFAASRELGYAKLSMPNYVNKPLDVCRHVFFLGKTGLWVKDRVTFSQPFQGKIGPGWQLNQTYETSASATTGPNWIVAASPAVALPQISLLSYLMHWDNRAEDLLVYFESPTSANMSVDTVLMTQSVHGNFQNNASKRAWDQISGSFDTNETHFFNSVLIPHAPADNAADIAASITFLQSSDEISIMEYKHVNDPIIEIVGINETGAGITIGEYNIETDARAFNIRFYQNELAQYWLVDTKLLSINNVELESHESPTTVKNHKREEKPPSAPTHLRINH